MVQTTKEQAVAGATTVEEVTEWARGLEVMHARIASHFARSEPRRRALAYLRGLLNPIESKNGWQLAKFTGGASADGVQRLVATCNWDADLVRDNLRAYFVDHLAIPRDPRRQDRVHEEGDEVGGGPAPIQRDGSRTARSGFS